MTYTDAAAVKSYLGVIGTTDDSLLAALVARAQAWIDSYTRRTFESAADTTRYLTVGVDTDGSLLFLPGDLCQITSVTTNADDGAGGQALAVNVDYITQPRNATPYYALKIVGSVVSWRYTHDPEMGISITGRWAYSLTPPADIVHACIRLAGYLYRQKDASTFDTVAVPDAGIITVPQGIPKDVRLILDNYRRPNL